MAGGTTVKLGYTNPLTDTFGAHPTLGAVVDLNDGLTFTLVSPDGLEIATRSITRHNRLVTARLVVGPSANAATLISAIRNLLTWLAAPPQQPITIQYQPFNASTPLYLDVVGTAHNLPSDEGQWLRGQFEPLTITFTCRPGLRGDRVTLQNLVANAGFEQPSGPGVQVFNDPLTNTNAYSVLSGAAPTLAANVMTIPNAAVVAFGSPAWGAIQTWQIRFQWATGLTASFNLHYTDTNNRLAAQIDANLYIAHVVAGTSHNSGITPVTLTNGTWYWVVISQFPAAPGEVADVVATLYADSAGVIGAQIATTGAQTTFDAVTALSGKSALWAAGTAALAVGGPKVVNPTQYVALFGPGAGTATASRARRRASVAARGRGPDLAARLRIPVGQSPPLGPRTLTCRQRERCLRSGHPIRAARRWARSPSQRSRDRSCGPALRRNRVGYMPPTPVSRSCATSSIARACSCARIPSTVWRAVWRAV